MISGHLSIRFGLKGPNLAIVTACTTGLHCIGEASRMIEYGDADVDDRRRRGRRRCRRSASAASRRRARCRSATTIPRRRAVRGTRIATVSCSAKAPASWCSKSTSTRRSAARRSTREVRGYGMSGDAYHMTAPPEDGDGARRCMLKAMKNAQRQCGRGDYVNAHGTSTQIGDMAETMGIKQCSATTRRRCGQLHEVDDGSHAGRAGGLESVRRAGRAQSGIAADHQHHRSGSRVPSPTIAPTRRESVKTMSRSTTRSASAGPTARWCSGRL